MNTRQTLLAQSVAAVLVIFTAGAASASAFQLQEQNASGLGNAYAGSASNAENASVLFNNAAAITELQSREVTFGVDAVKPSYRFSDRNSSSGRLKGDGGDAGGWAALPHFYASMQATKWLYFGLGISTPFGLETSYDSPWIGAAQSEHFKIETVNINPTVAFKVTPELSLGAGINWQYMGAEYERTLGAGLTTVPGVGSVPLNMFKAHLKADSRSWGWNVGALYDITDSTRMGFSYRSKITHKLEGNLSASGPSSALSNAFSSGAEATVTLPDTAVLSVSQRLTDRWSMMGDLSWTGWSTLSKVDIKRTSGPQSGQNAQTLHTEFRDTWRVALGANYRLNDSITLKYGVAYDETPVKGEDTRLVSLPDNDRVWFSTGVQWKPTKTSAVDVGAAYLYLPSATIHDDQRSSGAGLVDGEYKGNVWVFGVQYSIAF